MKSPDKSEVTSILLRASEGNSTAMSQLMPLVYQELRELASYYMRKERRGHTLQSTALVHEAYMRLVDQKQVQWKNRAHFFGVAAQAMRRILLDHARRHRADKRGGGKKKLPLEEALSLSEERAEEFIALDEALNRLQALDERQARVVELRFFAGLSIDETARILDVSPSAVKRDWAMAKAWLYRYVQETT